MRCKSFAPHLTWAALAVCTTGVLLDSSPCHAAKRSYIDRAYRGKRPKILDAHLGLSGYWGGGAALGFRFTLPVMDNGFVPSINNSVNIVLGLDFLYLRWYRYYNYGRIGFHIPILLNWAFHISPEFQAFAELGPAFTFFPRYRGYEARYRPRDFYGYLSGGIGMRFFVSQNMGIVLRLGSPTVALGLSFRM